LLTFFDHSYLQPLYDLSKLCAYSTYISIFLTFLMLRTRFAAITRDFVSPLGYFGAVFGMAVFALAFVSVCGFQDSYIAECAFVVLIMIAAAYYYLVVEKRQVFSEEEKKVMFKAYLLKGKRFWCGFFQLRAAARS
jgi:L-asparagine transporter-like permease